MFQQLFQEALQVGLTVAQALLQSTMTPLVDELGNPLACDVRADYAATSPTPTVCHVGLDPGAIHYSDDLGTWGLDQDTQSQIVQGIAAPDSALVYTVYTPLEPQRRYLADWLVWNIVSSYAVANGVRISSYPLVVLRNHLVVPQRSPLFDKVVYPPEDLGEARPFGLPWRAVVRLRCTILAAWGIPPISPASGILTIQPNNPPGNLGPPSAITFE